MDNITGQSWPSEAANPKASHPTRHPLLTADGSNQNGHGSYLLACVCGVGCVSNTTPLHKTTTRPSALATSTCKWLDLWRVGCTELCQAFSASRPRRLEVGDSEVLQAGQPQALSTEEPAETPRAQVSPVTLQRRCALKTHPCVSFCHPCWQASCASITSVLAPAHGLPVQLLCSRPFRWQLDLWVPHRPVEFAGAVLQTALRGHRSSQSISSKRRSLQGSRTLRGEAAGHRHRTPSRARAWPDLRARTRKPKTSSFASRPLGCRRLPGCRGGRCREGAG